LANVTQWQSALVEIMNRTWLNCIINNNKSVLLNCTR